MIIPPLATTVAVRAGPKTDEEIARELAVRACCTSLAS